MTDRIELSVGLTQDFSTCELRKKFIPWLEIQAPVSPDAKATLQHIHALEGLLAIEKYAVLSSMANELRNNLTEIRDIQNEYENRGYQRAINLVIDTIETLDVYSQAATSIAEFQSGALMAVAKEIRNKEDFTTVVKFANDIKDGCC